MPIVSFWNNEKEESGKTLSMIAIATYMAIMHNYKILVVDTEFNSETIGNCYWEKSRESILNDITDKRNDISTGIEGLAKAVMSNKSTPEIITNYTKIVFRDRLEVLLGVESKEYSEYQKISTVYKDILSFAKRTYDLVFVDLTNGVSEFSNEILEISDLIIVNQSQKISSIERFAKHRADNAALLSKDKTLVNMGRYDMFSKYNTKNVGRLLGERKPLLAIPYCTQFFEASMEGKVADYFIKYNKIVDITDKNSIFVMEVKRSVERIIYKLQEMQLKI